MPVPRREPNTGISRHEIAVYRTLHQAAENGRWLANTDIIRAVRKQRKIGDSTVRKITFRFAALGLLERKYVSTSLHYKLADGPLNPQAAAHRDLVHEAASTIGQPI